MIVDYKTNRPAAKTVDDVPLAYIKQLHAYKKLIAKIYQNKDVETYILWTNTATIMKIE
jgi:ATP-dependent helicase/nuclease subunit A